MEAQPQTIRPRDLFVALAVGAAPALLAWWLDPDVLRPHDLPVAAGILALALFAGFFLYRIPRDLSPRGAEQASALPGARWVALVLAAAPTVMAWFALPAPVTNDERSVLFQAELFAEGRLAEPLPPLPEAWRRRQVYEDAERGIRYSKYSPGAAALLAPAAALGAPHLTVLLLGFADLLLLGALARRLGVVSAGMAMLLLATSPFFLLVQTSFQSEVFTLPLALLGYLALLRVRDAGAARPAFGWGALCGAAAGAVFSVRPLTGVVLAAACGLGLLTSRRRVPAVAGALLGGLPFLALVLLYQWAQTGDPFAVPYDLYARRFGPFRPDGSPLDVYGNGDPLEGLLRQTARWSVAFGGVLGAVALGFWGLWRLRRRDGLAGLAFAVLLPVAYSFHWYPGHWAYLGPLYSYESLGLLVLGALALFAASPPRVRYGFTIALASFGPLAFVARWFPIQEEGLVRSAPERAVAAADLPPGAVVLLPPKGPGFGFEWTMKHWTPSRPSSAPADRLLLRRLPRAPVPALLERAGVAGRPVFRYVPESELGGGVVALE